MTEEEGSSNTAMPLETLIKIAFGIIALIIIIYIIWSAIGSVNVGAPVK